MHDRVLSRWARDFERDGYKIVGKKISYGGRRTIGEIDLLMYNGKETICEIKTTYRGFKKGIYQLRRTEEYFGREFEKYLIINQEIYYLY